MSMTSELWTDENVTLLRKLWGEGLSGSEIAKLLGSDVTRNAIIGKVHRLGLPERATPSRPLRPANTISARDRLDQKRDRRGQRRTSPIKIVKTCGTLSIETNVSVIALNVALLDLAPSMCRWPTGYNGEHLFCGHERESEHTPYCAAHKAASVNASLMEKVRKREQKFQKYMFGLTRFERQAA